MPANPRSRNSDYWVVIRNRAMALEIIADIPEQIGIDAVSHYQPVDPTGGLADGSKIPRTPSSLFGGVIIHQLATRQIWMGTEPISFGLQLVFDAETNSKEDVHDQLVRLQAMVLPENLGLGLLGPPNGYQLLGGTSGVSIQIGRQFIFDDVIINNASLLSESRMNLGYPIAGAINLSVTTHYVMTRGEYLAAAGVSPNPQSTPSPPNWMYGPGGVKIR